MRAKDTVRCTNCRRLQARVDALEAELAALKEVAAQLGQQLAAARKDFSTSSKPPSSDIVKPPKPPPPGGQDRRRIGGQPGHPKHERVAFPAEAINAGSFDHRLDDCPSCGHDLQPMRTVPPRVVQQVDIVGVPLSIQEHRSHPGWCPRCRKTYEAPLPPGIRHGGLVGPSLTTWIAYLKGACHASYSTVRKFLRDVAHVTISRGELARVIAKVSRALERPYRELLDDLPGQARLNVDETGHKRNGDRQWTWCFRAGLYTLFKIDPTRSGDVLIEVLGAEFDGVLGCDYFSSYRRYQREFGVLLQFCLAHLIRDVKYLTTLPDARDRAYGEGLREALRALFAVIHRREQLSETAFRDQLEAARAEVMRRGTREVPETRHSRKLASDHSRRSVLERGRLCCYTCGMSGPPRISWDLWDRMPAARPGGGRPPGEGPRTAIRRIGGPPCSTPQVRLFRGRPSRGRARLSGRAAVPGLAPPRVRELFIGVGPGAVVGLTATCETVASGPGAT